MSKGEHTMNEVSRLMNTARVVGLTVHAKANPSNKRQTVTVKSVTTRDQKIGRYVIKAGTECSGNMRVTDEQLAKLVAVCPNNIEYR